MLATLVHFLMIDKLFSVLESLSVGKVVLGLVLLLDFSVYVLGIARHVQLQHKSMFVKFLRRVIVGSWEILLGMGIFCIYSFTLCIAYSKLLEIPPP